jgi:predicted esterase
MQIWWLLLVLLGGGDFQKQLDIAGENRIEIDQAIRETPNSQKRGMAWLLRHMPEEDLKTLTGEFLLTNCDLAYKAWENAPWKEQISEEVFFDCILPYANVNERRDDWRGDFHEKFSKIVAQATTPTEATILLNKNLYDMLDVHYSTKRPKADQSPYESIDAGMASCTGLSILLIDACRSVGIPARFTGTPLWYNESGNHSWIEFWDEGWHYTEANTNKVDSAWFDGSAAKATKGHPKHAIFAVTWNKEDKHFPLVWLPDVQTYGAVDVTDRYLDEQETVLIPVRVRVTDKERTRQSRRIVVFNIEGEMIQEGNTKDESADANDHLTFMLPKGETFTFHCKNDVLEHFITSEVVLDLNTGGFTERGAVYYAAQLWAQQNFELDENVIEHEGKSMPFWYTTFGDTPFGERSLWISLHGGGGAPEKVNTQQWENQKQLYTLEEGVYVVPRSPTDTWNMWHQAHIDVMFDQLVKHMIKKEGVDPNKIYIIGYSAGGDGVYQLAPRMADRFAAAGMMAGHPNETLPDGLRNIGFALHVGGEDAAYERNIIASAWKQKFDALQQKDPSGYSHQVVVHEGKGHWMDRQETVALDWMATFTRNPYPNKIVWVQDDVLHNQFYWLGVDEPKARTKIIASIEGQTITIHETDVKKMTVYLNDVLVNLDEPVILNYQDREITTITLPRNIQTVQKTLRDPKNYYTASFTFRLP